MTLPRQRLNRSGGGGGALKQWEGDTLNRERVAELGAFEQCRNGDGAATMWPL